MLADITIVQDDPQDGVFACNGRKIAEIRDSGTDHLRIIVCPRAGFGHGGINKGYPGVPGIGCPTLDPRTSWEMDTLGASLLHEYVHFNKLVMPPLTEETLDPYHG